MAHIINNSIVEGLVDTLNYRGQLTSTVVSNSTLTLSLSTAHNQYLSGTTSGQIVNLGNALTYGIGHEWWIYNESTVYVSIRKNDNTELINLAPKYRVRAILIDNSTSAGAWTLGVLISLAAGGTLVALFSSTANAVSNKFLDTENIAASDTLPAVAARSSVLNLITYTNTSSVSTGTIEIRVNTTTGTPLASISFSSIQTYTQEISVPVLAGDSINCKIAAGASNVAKPLVKIYST